MRHHLFSSIFALAGLLGTSLLASPHSQVHEIPSENLVALKSDKADLQELIARSAVVDPIGIVVANIHSFSEEVTSVARSELDFGDRLKVLAVVKDSIGARLGLQPGDVLMELNSIYVPKGKDALEQLQSRILPQIDWEQPLSAMILRNGYAHALEADQPDGLAKASKR